MIGKLPICLNCKYYNENTFDKLNCQAFPEGIPDEILLGENNHTEPLEGQDNNIIFEPIEGNNK